MKKQKGNINVRREYRQAFLSGYESLIQSRNEDGNSKTLPRLTDSPPQVRKGERSYNLSIKVIVEQVSNDSGQYTYRICLADDPHLSVAPYSVRGKKETGQTVDLPKKGIKGGDSFSMVYGIHEDGSGTLSHTPQHPIQRVAPQIYSFILGAIDRAIECTILKPENEATNDDTRKRSEGTPTQENVGTDKKERRGKKVLPEILPETLPEETTVLVAADGAILGWRQIDPELRLAELGGGTDQRGELADTLASGETPDLGF